eukprot:1716429-Prymnesium_polylepis.2
MRHTRRAQCLRTWVVPAGPRLHLRVVHGDAEIVDGHAAAAALARAQQDEIAHCRLHVPLDVPAHRIVDRHDAPTRHLETHLRAATRRRTRGGGAAPSRAAPSVCVRAARARPPSARQGRVVRVVTVYGSPASSRAFTSAGSASRHVPSYCGFSPLASASARCGRGNARTRARRAHGRRTMSKRG